MRKVTLLLAAALLVVPALAVAGKKATAGDQSLQITSSIAPAKAGTAKKPRGVTLKVGVDYESLNDNAQVKENSKSVALRLPAGMTLHTSARPQCMFSQLLASGPSACPSGSQVGQGTATADARPAVAQPLEATVTIYNGLDDTNPDGSPRSPAVPAVLFYAATSTGITTSLPFDISGSKLELDYAPPQPGQSQLFHLQKVNATFPKGSGKPYITAPTKCHRTWTSSMTIANYDGPSVTATDTVRCRR